MANSEFILGGLIVSTRANSSDGGSDLKLTCRGQGTIAFVALVLHSPSVIRHAFYEAFLHVHIALVVLCLWGLWLHLKNLPQMPLLVGVIVLWAMEV